MFCYSGETKLSNYQIAEILVTLYLTYIVYQEKCAKTNIYCSKRLQRPMPKTHFLEFNPRTEIVTKCTVIIFIVPLDLNIFQASMCFIREIF